MMAERQPTPHPRHPRTIGDEIREDHSGDHAAWFAALTGLPYAYVARKFSLTEEVV